MRERLTTAKMTPWALQALRLAAAATGETQWRVLNRLLLAELRRLKIGVPGPRAEEERRKREIEEGR